MTKTMALVAAVQMLANSYATLDTRKVAEQLLADATPVERRQALAQIGAMTGLDAVWHLC